MRYFVSWKLADGSITKGADWNSAFHEYPPLVGDIILHKFDDGYGIHAVRVAARFLSFDERNEPTWHFIFETTELAAGLDDILQLHVLHVDGDKALYGYNTE